MKKINKNLSTFMVVSALAFALLASPLVSSAHNNGNQGNGKAKVELQAKAKAKNNNSFWSRIFGGFFGSLVKAANNGIKQGAAPSIAGVTAPTVLRTGETGTWTVRASDPQNGSLTYAVNWGDSQIEPSSARANAFVQSSTFTHAYAAAGTYTVKFTVTNSAGLSTTSTVTVHVTGSTAQAAPVISNLSATSANRPHQATVTWKTDVRSSSMVWYSKTSPVDTTGKPTISRPDRAMNHQVVLKGLEAGTQYFVIVGSGNAGGVTMSKETSFTTPKVADRETPVIKSIDSPKEVTVGATATVTVNAYDLKNRALSYSVDWGDTAMTTDTALMAKRAPIYVQSATFNHTYTEAGTYKATFTVENSAGKKTSSSVDIVVSQPIR